MTHSFTYNGVTYTRLSDTGKQVWRDMNTIHPATWSLFATLFLISLATQHFA